MPIWFPETSEEGGSCLEDLGEGTKRNGVWSVFSLDMKEMAPGREGVEVCFVPDVRSTLRVEVYTWEKV